MSISPPLGGLGGKKPKEKNGLGGKKPKEKKGLGPSG